jgi:hypothetical protein
LPPVDLSRSGDEVSAIEKFRACPDCNQETRIVSNFSGVTAYCGPCKKSWPISSMPRASILPVALPRGLSKQTLVEPDWSRAQDNPHGDPLNEQVGPKRR